MLDVSFGVFVVDVFGCVSETTNTCKSVHGRSLEHSQDAKPPDSSRYAVLKSELAQERARADKLQLLNDEAVVSELCQSSGCARTNHRWSGDVDIVRELSTDQVCAV